MNLYTSNNGPYELMLQMTRTDFDALLKAAQATILMFCDPASSMYLTPSKEFSYDAARNPVEEQCGKEGFNLTQAIGWQVELLEKKAEAQNKGPHWDCSELKSLIQIHYCLGLYQNWHVKSIDALHEYHGDTNFGSATSWQKHDAFRVCRHWPTTIANGRYRKAFSDIVVEPLPKDRPAKPQKAA